MKTFYLLLQKLLFSLLFLKSSDYSYKDNDDEEDSGAQRSYRKKKKINKGRWTKDEVQLW